MSFKIEDKYRDAKIDYLRLKHNQNQTGGFIILKDTELDEILLRYNIKFYKEIVENPQSSVENYNSIAEILLDAHKYKKYLELKQLNNYKSSFKTSITKYYLQTPELFDEIYSHNNKDLNLSRERKIFLIKSLSKIFDKDLWRKIKDFTDNNKLNSIFTYYNDTIFNESDNVIIVDTDNYVLYTNGDFNLASTYIFNLDNFSLAKDNIANIVSKTLAKKKRFVSQKPIITTKFTIYDIYTLYGKILEVINGLIKLNNTDRNVSLLPNTINFLETIFNIKRGEFTSKNQIVYSFLFINKINVLLKLIDSSLNKTKLVSNLTETIKIDEDFGSFYEEDTIKEFSEKQKILYNELYRTLNKTGLESLIRAFNYFGLTNLGNKIEFKNVKMSPNLVLSTFIKELEKFLNLLTLFRDEFSKIIHSFESVDASIFVKLCILTYISYVLKEKTNIHLDKIKVTNNLTDSTHKDNSNNKTTSLQQNQSTKWLYNISTNVPHFRLLNEFNISIKNISFHSCGETMTLNLMNYLLLSNVKSDLFDLSNLNASQELVDFYTKYPSMTKMIQNEKQAVSDWAVLISNFPDISYKSGSHELIPTHSNVYNLYQLLLPTSIIDSNEIKLMPFIKTISPNVFINDVKIPPFTQSIIVDDYYVNFSSLHGEMTSISGEKYINDDVKVYIKVCDFIINAPRDFFKKVIFTDNIDFAKTQEFERLFYANDQEYAIVNEHYNYVLNNGSIKMIEHFMFSDGLTTGFIEKILNYCSTLKASSRQTMLIDMVFGERAKNDSRCVKTIYTYYSTNKMPLFSEKIKEFLVGTDLYVTVTEVSNNNNAILQAVLLGIKDSVIEQLILNPNSIELTNVNNYNTILLKLINKPNLYNLLLDSDKSSFGISTIRALSTVQYYKFKSIVNKQIEKDPNLLNIMIEELNRKPSENLLKYIKSLPGNTLMNLLKNSNSPLINCIILVEPDIMARLIKTNQYEISMNDDFLVKLLDLLTESVSHHLLSALHKLLEIDRIIEYYCSLIKINPDKKLCDSVINIVKSLSSLDKESTFTSQDFTYVLNIVMTNFEDLSLTVINKTKSPHESIYLSYLTELIISINNLSEKIYNLTQNPKPIYNLESMYIYVAKHTIEYIETNSLRPNQYLLCETLVESLSKSIINSLSNLPLLDNVEVYEFLLKYNLNLDYPKTTSTIEKIKYFITRDDFNNKLDSKILTDLLKQLTQLTQLTQTVQSDHSFKLDNFKLIKHIHTSLKRESSKLVKLLFYNLLSSLNADYDKVYDMSVFSSDNRFVHTDDDDLETEDESDLEQILEQEPVLENEYESDYEYYDDDY